MSEVPLQRMLHLEADPLSSAKPMKWLISSFSKELIDYKTSVTKYEDPLRACGGNQGLEFSHALPFVLENSLKLL